MERKRVGILIFPEVEVLDFCGPFEVFSVTRLNEERRREEPSPFEPFLVAATPDPVTTNGGMRVLPAYTLADCPPLHLLVVPGGWGTRPLMKDANLLAWLRRQAGEVGMVASVCTGSLLLGAAGLLDGRRATTHFAALDLLQDTFPAVKVERTLHFVEDGSLITSAGISAGIDMALRVVVRYHGEAVARATARYMEYPFPKSAARRISPEGGR